MSKELKPCPFCSHTPMIFNQTGLVVCRYSMCSANPQANSKEDWNKRTTDRLEQENVKMKEQRDTWSKLFHSENKENNRLLQENAELREALNVLVYKDSWGNYFTGLHGDSDVTEIVKKLLNK